MNSLTPQYETADELVAHGLEPGEIDELREWFCYTKPIGPSVRIVATPACAGAPGLCVLSAGTHACRKETSA